jgi:hypothetical protein
LKKIIALLVITLQKHQSNTYMLALVLFSEHPYHPSCTMFLVEMSRYNFMDHTTRIFRKVFMIFIQSETPVCHPVLQVISDEGWVFESFHIVNVCPALFEHSTPLSRVCIIHYTFPIHCNKLTVYFNRRDILCVQKPNYSSHFTTGGILDFLTNF